MFITHQQFGKQGSLLLDLVTCSYLNRCPGHTQPYNRTARQESQAMSVPLRIQIHDAASQKTHVSFNTYWICINSNKASIITFSFIT